jgi:hypothetical protein
MDPDGCCSMVMDTWITNRRVRVVWKRGEKAAC